MSSSGRPERGRLRALRKAYAERLPIRIAELAGSCRDVIEGNGAVDRLEHARQLASGLAGSAGGFGYSRVSSVAHRLDELLIDILGAGAAEPDQREALGTLLDELDRAAAHPDDARARARTQPNLVSASDVAHRRARTHPDPLPRSVYIIDEDAHLSGQTATQLSMFGYQVRTFTDAEELVQAINDEPPSALITDIVSANGELAGAELSRGLRDHGHGFPILFVSARRDLTARLEAVRAGGNEYLLEPFDTVELIEKLDQLTTDKPADPFRVLVVDAKPDLGQRCVPALERAGMRTHQVDQPMRIMESLVNFRPDVVLMEVDLPQYDGLELAMAIRQQDAYVTIPIVFVTSDPRFGSRLVKSQLGGEPHLVTPFADDYLIFTVVSQARRSRTLQSLMVRDSLTGLLNHTRIKEQLQYEVDRARRDGSQLSYAMLDIDHFKSVNDTFGHPAGDRVLKSLARLLQRCLRKTDFVGRYGGDEFAVVLPGTDGRSATRLLDSIRQTFTQVREEWSSKDAPSTGFSCGVSNFSNQLTGAELNAVADRALYDAKKAGRNRVVLAGD
jgi:diguanylate cyclase (GGDEF)-like protein